MWIGSCAVRHHRDATAFQAQREAEKSLKTREILSMLYSDDRKIEKVRAGCHRLRGHGRGRGRHTSAHAHYAGPRHTHSRCGVQELMEDASLRFEELIELVYVKGLDALPEQKVNLLLFDQMIVLCRPKQDSKWKLVKRCC